MPCAVPSWTWELFATVDTASPASLPQTCTRYAALRRLTPSVQQNKSAVSRDADSICTDSFYCDHAPLRADAVDVRYGTDPSCSGVDDGSHPGRMSSPDPPTIPPWHWRPTEERTRPGTRAGTSRTRSAR